MYVYTYVKYGRLVYTYQNLYYLATTLANTDGLLVLDFYYLASILSNTNNILKV